MKRWAASRTEAKQTVERARIILGCLDGKRIQQIAQECGTRPNTVIKWRQRFVQGGLDGLRDAPRPGAKPVYGADFRNQVLAGQAFGRDDMFRMAYWLASNHILYGTWRQVIEYPDHIDRVSAEQVRDYCAAYLVPDNRTTGILVSSKEAQ